MDWISNLPEPIIHEILSRLPEKDAARASVLSKAWKHKHSTWPILVLDQSRYGIHGKPPRVMGDYTRKRNNFCNYVDSTLLRFHSQGLTIKQLKLWMDLLTDVPSASPRIDFWMELVKKCGVQVLDLTLHRIAMLLPSDERYHLPPSVLESKSLIKLTLYGRISVDHAFLNHPIMFSSLKVLYFRSVRLVDKRVIQNLVKSCPLIEYITLHFCSGLNSVIMHGPSMLKGVDIVGLITEVDIDAPSLQNFSFNPMDSSLPCKIILDKCTSLKELYLIGLTITDQWFLQHYHLFVVLEILELRTCTMPRTVNISCPQLKVMKLHESSRLKNAYIDAPKLYLCSYIAGKKIPILSFLNSSSQLEISFKHTTSGAFNYRKLREFFQELGCRNVLATLSAYLINQHEDVELETDILRDFPVPPPSIKHLCLNVSFGESVCSSLVTGLLWSCRPAIISCDLSSRTFIKVLCEKLMNGKEEDCCCSSSHIKCWWHGLKGVEVTSSSGTDGNENAVDCKTFLDAVLPTLTDQGDVSIRLE